MTLSNIITWKSLQCALSISRCSTQSAQLTWARNLGKSDDLRTKEEAQKRIGQYENAKGEKRALGSGSDWDDDINYLGRI